MKASYIRGLLLEEAVLHLLKGAGYTTIQNRGVDETLEQDGDALYVKGRGERHQIDAIADYCIQPPFGHKQRLLIEAKYFKKNVGLPVARNAVGVLHDVSQYFTSSSTQTARKPRYHYQYALASATNFSIDCERYAYAHDIFLIPLRGSKYFQHILTEIQQASEHLINSQNNSGSTSLTTRLRREIRSYFALPIPDLFPRTSFPEITNFLKACTKVGKGFIGTTPIGLTLFLTLNPEVEPPELQENISVRICWNKDGWYLKDQSGKLLFSFDIPMKIFDLYAESGDLNKEQALNLKEENLRNICILFEEDGLFRKINLTLDMDWIEQIRNSRSE